MRDHMFLQMNNRLLERWSHEFAPAGGVTDWPRGWLGGEGTGGWCEIDMEGVL